jgi:hypothetical protein
LQGIPDRGEKILKNRTDDSAAFSRRRFFAAGVALSLQCSVSLAAAAREPLAILTEIYRDAVKGKGPSWIDAADRPKYLSRSLVALWAKTDKKLVAGDEGPVDFDLVADTNGLTLTGFSLKSEKQDDTTATIAATLVYKEGPRPEPTIVRYDLKREGGQWKIDEIRGGNWSVRDMLTLFLKQ